MLFQIKKFHSDNAPSDANKKDLEEITKCIITAFDEIKKSELGLNEKPSEDREALKDE